MSVELRVPSVGESITEVQIGEWLKKPGDTVQQDEPVVVIETDKVTVELPAPSSGVISSILVQTGKTAAVGEVIGALEAGVAGGASAKAAPTGPPPTIATSNTVDPNAGKSRRMFPT